MTKKTKPSDPSLLAPFSNRLDHHSRHLAPLRALLETIESLTAKQTDAPDVELAANEAAQAARRLEVACQKILELLREGPRGSDAP